MSLTTDLWIAAYRVRLEAQGAFVHIARKGDVHAGAILIKVATMDGRAILYQRSFDLMTGERAWVVLCSGEERAVDEAADKQASFDPDVWVVEVEDPKGRHLLDDPTLAL